jgi:hypothetical protein
MFVFKPQVVIIRIMTIIFINPVFNLMLRRVNAKFQDLFCTPPNPKY